MDFAEIIREIEEEISRLEQVRFLLKGDPFEASTVHRGIQLSPEEQEESAADRCPPPRSS